MKKFKRIKSIDQIKEDALNQGWEVDYDRTRTPVNLFMG